MNKVNETKINKGSSTKKIKNLQRQYEKILVDLFDQFAAESIEEALEKNEGSFGENIQDIVQCALDCLKTKVMKDLGVNDTAGKISISMGGFGDGMGIISSDDEPEEGETEEHEAEESPEFEAGEEEEKKEDEEEDEDEEDEGFGESNESLKRDKIISANRRSDQVMLTEAYTKVRR